ncbi:MAG TPA: phage head-tail connector protein [Acidimicrobiia bacterium]
MRYGLQVVEAAAQAPSTVAEVKARARIDFSEEDHFLAGRIDAAAAVIEESLQRCLITRTLRMTLDAFPYDLRGTIYLPRSPVQSITAIRYLDTAGVQQTLAADQYRVDTASVVSRVSPAYGVCWPSTRCVDNAVEIDFVCGYGDNPSDVPQPIRDAISILVATWHGPGRLAVGTKTQPMPMSVDYLLGPYRVGTVPGS